MRKSVTGAVLVLILLLAAGLAIGRDRKPKKDPVLAAAAEAYYTQSDKKLPIAPELTSSYVESIAEAKDRGRKVELLLGLLGLSAQEMKVPVLYPYLGRLRQDLLDINASRLFEKAGPGGEAPGHVARLLLAYWQDPADDKLTMAWLKVTENGYAPAIPIGGATIEEVCNAYAELHFRADKEKGKELPLFHFEPALLGPRGERGLVEFVVKYSNWGYGQTLVLRKEGEEWHMRFHVEGEHRYQPQGDEMVPVEKGNKKRGGVKREK
jgi:hypothetical protein